MSNENSLKRRNISWKKSTDELAERMSIDREISVSGLLEQLIFEEARSQRIKPRAKSSLFDVFRDIAAQVFEEMGNQSEGLSQNLEKKGKQNLKESK